MTIRIRLEVSTTGHATCSNHSRETVSIRLPHAPDYLSIRPNTRFEGDYRKYKREPLAPEALTDIETTFVSYPQAVRRAGVDDIDDLMSFVPQILEETTLLPLSMSKIEAMVKRCATQQGGAIAGIIDGEDGIDASIGLLFSESETSDTPFIRAAWCGLHPNVRKGGSEKKGASGHYGRTMFEFAKWCHAGLERAAGHPILIQFDVATRTFLGQKIGLYERNMRQVGASFAFGSVGEFLSQGVEEAVEAA
jgi:hypothetical protein